MLPVPPRLGPKTGRGRWLHRDPLVPVSPLDSGGKSPRGSKQTPRRGISQNLPLIDVRSLRQCWSEPRPRRGGVVPVDRRSPTAGTPASNRKREASSRRRVGRRQACDDLCSCPASVHNLRRRERHWFIEQMRRPAKDTCLHRSQILRHDGGPEMGKFSIVSIEP